MPISRIRTYDTIDTLMKEVKDLRTHLIGANHLWILTWLVYFMFLTENPLKQGFPCFGLLGLGFYIQYQCNKTQKLFEKRMNGMIASLYVDTDEDSQSPNR